MSMNKFLENLNLSDETVEKLAYLDMRNTVKAREEAKTPPEKKKEQETGSCQLRKKKKGFWG